MAHTPGPWDYSEDKAGFVVDANGVEIGEVFGESSRAEECDDNNALIVAAPELLAALKELVHYDEGSSEQGSYGYEVLRMCKAAIARAENRSE